MSNNQLPADVESRLDAAVKRRSLSHDYASGYKEGYIAGATAENNRAQPAIDTLEQIANAPVPLNGNEMLAWTDMVKNLCEKALQQWRGEKEVIDPCPHCGKELSLDRNLCCRECGKEVGDE